MHLPNSAATSTNCPRHNTPWDGDGVTAGGTIAREPRPVRRPSRPRAHRCPGAPDGIAARVRPGRRRVLRAPLSDQIGRRPALLTAVGLAAAGTTLFLGRPPTARSRTPRLAGAT